MAQARHARIASSSTGTPRDRYWKGAPRNEKEGESVANPPSFFEAIMWSCPKCKRGFTRKNQRHACGTGNRLEVLRGRPDSLVALYSSLESFAKTLGPVELVARDRYVLFR